MAGKSSKKKGNSSKPKGGKHVESPPAQSYGQSVKNVAIGNHSNAAPVHGTMKNLAVTNVENWNLPLPFINPELRYLSATSRSKGGLPTFSIDSLLTVNHFENPMVIFGEPYMGKTCLMVKLAQESRLKWKNNWIQFIDLFQLISIYKRYPTARIESSPSAFLELLAIYLHTTTSEQSLKERFRPLSKAKDHLRKGKFAKLIKGELFLEGFDELAPPEKEICLKLLPQMVSKRTSCPIRIWFTARSYSKTRIMNILGMNGSAFEMIKLTQPQQLQLLRDRWKLENPEITEKNKRLNIFVKSAYSDLEKEFVDFPNSLGCIPFFIHVIAGILSNAAHDFIHENSTNCTFHIPQLYERIARIMVESHCIKSDKYSAWSERRVEEEYQRIARIHCKFAVQTYPSFEYKMTEDQSDSKNKDEDNVTITDEHFRIGFITKDNDKGVVTFLNKSFGDFFLGRHFAFPTALQVRDPLLDGFLLRILLYADEAKKARMFYDAHLFTVYITRPAILRDFLVNHYKLGKGKEKEWEELKNKGTLWHVAMMEGFHRIAQVLLDSFRPCDLREMRQFLRISAPFTIDRGIPSTPKCNRLREFHIVSSLSALALFGYDEGMGELIKMFHRAFDIDELREEFTTGGRWTPLHYAAMHSNLWFIAHVFNMQQIQPPPGVRNPVGQLALHLLMTYAWCHTISLKDPYNPDYDKKFFKKDTCRELTANCVMVKDPMGMKGATYCQMRDTQHCCIEYLVNKGHEDVNAMDKIYQMTILHYAARDGMLETVKLILGLGATVDELDACGRAPIHHAALFGHRKIFVYLVLNKSKPTQCDVHGISAIATWRLKGAENDNDGPISEEEKIFFKTCERVDKLMSAEFESFFKRRQRMRAISKKIKARTDGEKENTTSREDGDGEEEQRGQVLEDDEVDYELRVYETPPEYTPTDVESEEESSNETMDISTPD